MSESKEGNMPETVVLASQIEQLDSGYSFWVSIGIWLLIIAGLVAIGIAVAAVVANRKGIALNKIKDELIRAKDEQLARDLKDKDVQIATADKKAAEANAVASKANEGLAKSNEEIARLTAEAEAAKTERAEADKQIAIAKENAERAKADAAKASQRTAEVSLKVEEEGRKRVEAERLYLELKERIKGRHLTEAQSAQLLKRFNEIPVKGAVIIWCFESVSDSCAFAEEFQAVFKKANWPHGFVKITSTSFVPPVGLLLAVQDANNVPAHTEYLGQAFASIGFDVLGVSGTSFTDKRPPNTVSFVIGSKP